jgi:hypothetical protein
MNPLPITALSMLLLCGAVRAEVPALFKGADLKLGERLIAQHKCNDCHARQWADGGKAVYRPARGRRTQGARELSRPRGVRAVFAEGRTAGATSSAAPSPPRGRHGRRAALARPNPVPAEGGDPNILNLPEHSRGPGPAGGHRRLRQAVEATRPTCSAARARA